MPRPIVQQLPPAPQRGEDFQTFTEKANAHVAALTPWTDQVNEVGEYIEQQAVETDQARQQAAQSAQNAATSEQNAADSEQAAEGYKDSAETAAAAAQSAAGLPAIAGKAGNYLAVKDDESGVAFKPIPEGMISKYEEFTTSGTWTKDPGATWVAFHIVAGGAALAGSGGQGAFYLLRASELGSSESVTVGAGVAASVTGAAGDTSFAGYTVKGGQSTGEARIQGRYSAFFPNADLGDFLYATRGESDGYGRGSESNPDRPAGNSVYGGGGGHRGNNEADRGVSIFAGNGGLDAEDGEFPGGAGGFSGAGADGVVRIWQW